ncbi:hypothetical protein [Streptomyces yaizuensis]|uniref:DUF3558 domain-containing protein n=1 Tax=Streptomyces yaizuensis TaxID=2989713 RepID=A0ABQ5P622_9ACTN|nr:hypothetical protein [Streptomyces sp. YSPA8]GLF98043.1 hypothetical protein SYYSPA8_27120 [Streptomyces sp. YSPA8]
MTRSRFALPAALVTALALTSCSSSDDGNGKAAKDATELALTKQFTQGEITQAIPEGGEAPAGYDLGNRDKGLPGTADDCTHTEGEKPAGWTRGGDTDYHYQGSTSSRMMDLNICQFDTAANAKSAYSAWTHRDGLTAHELKAKAGDETAFLLNRKSGSAYAYARSGTVNIEVKIEDASGDVTDAHDMLSATLKRLQQVQAGKRPTATAAEEAAQAEQQ